MLWMRQISIAGLCILECHQIYVSETEILLLRAVIDPMLERYDAWNLILQLPERICDLLDLVFGGSLLELKHNDVPNPSFFLKAEGHG